MIAAFTPPGWATSTVLLKIDGFTILTDPVFSARVGLSFGPLTLGIKRLVAPALLVRELPKIDLILLSHAHFDHLDMPSMAALQNSGATLITASKTADSDARQALRGSPRARLGRAYPPGSAGDSRLPCQSLRARAMRTDSYRGYNGYTIDAGRYRVLFGGDTAATDIFQTLRTSRPFDLAIMPVGAYNPWIHYHCTPEQAWRMARDAGSEFFLPVHHQTFTLSREPVMEPIERLREIAGRDSDRVALGRIGQEFHWE